MWLSPASQHHRYDLHCDTGAREVPRTEHEPLYILHRSDQSIQHGQYRRPVGHTQKTCLPSKVHQTDPMNSHRHERRSLVRWRAIRSIYHLQWHEAKLCLCSGALQPVLHPSAVTCCEGLEPGRVHQLPSQRLTVRPSKQRHWRGSSQKLSLQMTVLSWCIKITIYRPP